MTPITTKPSAMKRTNTDDLANEATDGYVLPTPDSPLRLRTKLAFATMTALGAMVIGTGDDVGGAAGLVVVVSIIGFVCVDWLKLFSLPAMVAYAAMIIAAAYCVSSFYSLLQGATASGNRMVAVAELLLIAQTILMLQAKNQRIFEQLVVFAILNCVVAAVFNDAFSYGIWLIPLCITLGLALCFLAADSTVEHVRDSKFVSEERRTSIWAILGRIEPFWRRDHPRSATSPRLSSDPSQRSVVNNEGALSSFSRAGRTTPIISIFVLFPAVAGVAALFFFGLPRTTQARRGSTSGAPLTGFNDKMRLEQIGQMLTNNRLALRVRMRDPQSKLFYPVAGGVYLRGRVLEQYDATNILGNWTAVSNGGAKLMMPLAPEFISDRSSDDNFFDRVRVDIEAEPSSSTSLFAIAPFHRTPRSSADADSDDVISLLGRWTIQRLKPGRSNLIRRQPRIRYAFETTGFNDGVQSEWTRFQSEQVDQDGREANVTEQGLTAADLDYIDQTLVYPSNLIPSAKLIADSIVDEMEPDRRDAASIARRFQDHLAQSGNYTYTLNLNAAIQTNMDPIEQFLTVDRRGHCQYFASALAMMLRSQSIPSRVVVGYHTDEFNELGQYFVARQSHAHAWVEALISKEDIPQQRIIYGQAPADQYWLRLDPTPGGGGVDAAGSGSQVLDIAQSLWDDYVIEMDPKRQNVALRAAVGLAPMTDSYRSWIDEAKDLAAQINAGDIGGLAKTPRFSVPAAIVAIVSAVVGIIVFRLRPPRWWRRRFGDSSVVAALQPSLPFYAETVAWMEENGPLRQPSQTPSQFNDDFVASVPTLASPQRTALNTLTRAFYELRYAADDKHDARWQPKIEESLTVLRQVSSSPTLPPNPTGE
ncbi:MAG: DUF3488 and transglutaminase-like domain-containing protein [Planctomycetota bacterium]